MLIQVEYKSVFNGNYRKASPSVGKTMKIVKYRFGTVTYFSREEFTKVPITKHTYPESNSGGISGLHELLKKHSEIYGFIVGEQKGKGYIVFFDSDNNYKAIEEIAILELTAFYNQREKEEKEKEEVRKKIEMERAAEAQKARERMNQQIQLEQRARAEERRQAIELHKKQNQNILSFFIPSKFRETHCYQCNRMLFSSTHSECSKCKWLTCNCGACGCNYMKSY